MNIISYALKDIKAQKVRTIMGVVGVGVSIFLLSTILFLTDTASSVYIDYLTTDSGNVDYDIHQRYLTGGQEMEDYWFEYQPLIDKIQNATDQISGYIPRAIYYFSANYSGNNLAYFHFIGLNLTHEDELNFGLITSTDYDFVKNGIPKGGCVINKELSDRLGVKTGDTLNISRWRFRNGTARPNWYMNLTVYAVFESALKFPSYQSSVCLVDLEDLPYDLNLTKGDTGSIWYMPNRVNHLYLTLKDSDLKYDIRNIKGSRLELENIGAKIQFAIGYGYWIEMPKLEILEYSEYLTMASSMIFVIISLISMLISGILISGILSTSVEERIREFGIFRTLGAHKSFNLKLVIIEGLLLCILGTTLGVFSSMILLSKVLLPLIGRILGGELGGLTLNFVARPESFIISYTLGILVSLLVSISPAIKVSKLQIVQAINPYRHEENLYKIQRGQSVNYKLLLSGVLLALNGGVVYFLIPRLMASMDITLMSTVFILILLVFLIGITMTAIGIIPIILRLWIYVFTPFRKKLINIIKVTIFRHQRRNSSTILMFSLSFSFVMFTTSMVSIMIAQITTMIEFNQGSPLVLYRDGTNLYTPTVDLQQELMQVEGIEKSCAVIANPNQLSQIYSEEGKTFSAELGDYIYLKSSTISLYGVDNNYLDTVFTQFNDFRKSDMYQAFDDLFNGSNTCIISQSLSESLSLGMYDTVRITFNRGEEISYEEYTIVGIAAKLSGFPRFRETSMGGMGSGFSSGGMGGSFMPGGGSSGDSGAGVLISKDNYIRDMKIPNPAWVYKIFINIKDNANPSKVSNDIKETLGDKWDFRIRNVKSTTDQISQEFFIVQLALLAILSFTVIICMFGLFSSSYSSILERKREIGILRALGLKKKGLSRLFKTESLIILLSSGTTGSLTGFFTASLLTDIMVLFTESPRILEFPWVPAILLFSISVLILLVGMSLLLWKVKKQNLIEIFRETT